MEKHLSLEDWAWWLTGDLPHETVVNRIVPHVVAHCAVCRERLEELRSLQRAVGHWSESVALFEGREAPRQLAELEPLPVDEQLRRVEQDESLQTWGFCQLLLSESRQQLFDQPEKAVALAEIAVHVAERLNETAYDPAWVLDLQVRAWAALGNSCRVLGELRGAEAALREAFSRLEKSQTGDPLVRAEVLHYLGALRRAQRRLDEAREVLDRAFSAYEEAEDPLGRFRVRLTRAQVRDEAGDLEGAISELQAILGDVDPGESRLLAYAQQNLAYYLMAANRHQEAEPLLATLRDRLQDHGSPLDLVRLRYFEGLVAAGYGRAEEAEEVFREVQSEFFERRMGYDAALVSLDLGVLMAEQGRTAELKRLALEILPLFELRDVHREAMAALFLFQRAAEEERLTVELARQVAASLRRERAPGI
ncbi:MAG TPA: tetratricopeptide repeat protein [Thermoanaerobaculia bacterium]|nr:tetratricopeptide repeat protein [Thermoanaerobaculia bacterium]